MPEAPNIAREIVLSSGLSVRTDAYSISRACATSFQAVASGGKPAGRQRQCRHRWRRRLLLRFADRRQQKLGRTLVDLSKARTLGKNSSCSARCARAICCRCRPRWRSTLPACAWATPPSRWRKATASAANSRMRWRIDPISAPPGVARRPFT